MSEPGRRLAGVSAAVFAVSLAPGVMAGVSGVAAGTAALVARERVNGSTSLLVDLENLPTSRRGFDQLIALLPSDRKVTPGHVPEGWTLEQRGKQVRASGPAVGEVNLRLDLEGNYFSDYVGKEASVQGGLAGQLDAPIKVRIGSLPKVSPTPDLDGILTVPPRAVAGQPILIGVAPPYRKGTWELMTIDGSVPLLPIEAIRDMEVIKDGTPSAVYGLRATGGVVQLMSRPEPRPFITAFPENGDFLGVKYTDRWGELMVDGPIRIRPALPSSGPRSITGGSSLTIAGQAACVGGTFPDFNAPYGLLLDNKIELPVWGASQTTIMVGIPDATAPGSHTISVPGGSSSITIGVLTVEGTLDQNKLWRGESTTMRLRVIGTDRQFPLAILNRTPATITIDGGISQSVMTSGGRDNAVSRSVKGIRRGNFTIAYSVNAPGCGEPSDARYP